MMINVKQMSMNKILVILSFIMIACSNNASQEQTVDKDEHKKHDTVTKEAHLSTHTTTHTNKGGKWKADEATKKNVAAIVKIINDGSNLGESNRAKLTMQLQAGIDTLVQQCRMKGPDHDALHVWLEGVLHDVKEMKEGDNDYQKSYAVLKKDVESFYTQFE